MFKTSLLSATSILKRLQLSCQYLQYEKTEDGVNNPAAGSVTTDPLLLAVVAVIAVNDEDYQELVQAVAQGFPHGKIPLPDQLRPL